MGRRKIKNQRVETRGSTGWIRPVPSPALFVGRLRGRLAVASAAGDTSCDADGLLMVALPVRGPVCMAAALVVGASPVGSVLVFPVGAVPVIAVRVHSSAPVECALPTRVVSQGRYRVCAVSDARASISVVH